MRRAIGFAVLSAALLSCAERPCEPLIRDDQIVGDAIPVSLTGKTGDAQRGRDVFVDREGGHCLLCHSLSGLDAPFQGDLAPDLAGVGARLSLGQIRLQIVDAALINPDTIMPSYYRTHGFHQVGNSYAGAPALSSQDVEDLAAFLASLKETPG